MEQRKIKATLRILEKKRENLFFKLQLLYDRSKDLDTDAKVKEFRIRYAALEELKVNFEKVINDWNEVNIELDDNFDPDFQAIDSFSDLYYEIKSIAQELERESKGAEPKARTGACPRLPKIDLLPFDGDPLKWPLFVQTFRSLIHDNPCLDETSKIHYLLGALKGKALAVCGGILPAAENYSILWQALLDKYDDKRLLATTYLRQLLDFKPLTNENVNSLSLFIEKVDSAVNSLKNLGISDLGDFVIATIALSKLDSQTRVGFEKTLDSQELPSFNLLSQYVKSQVKVLNHSNFAAGSLVKRSADSPKFHSFAVSNPKLSVINRKCDFCKSDSHWIFKCSKFLALAPIKRREFAQSNLLCYNCLKTGHHYEACLSSYKCGVCRKKHHSLLHNDNEPGRASSSGEGPSGGGLQVSLVSTEECSGSYQAPSTVALATAVVLAYSASGEMLRMRVLIDSGSQCSLITKEFLKKLRLRTQSINATVSGIGSQNRSLENQVLLKFASRINVNLSYEVSALVIDRITDRLPTCEIDRHIQAKLKKLRLADDTFGTPGPIDGVIGAELTSELLGHKKHLGNGLPCAIDSPLGLIISGRLKSEASSSHLQSYYCVDSSNLNTLMERFWEIEEIENKAPVCPEDEACERMFQESVKRDETGRYTVALPFLKYPPSLGDSYNMALRRLLTLEKKFSHNLEFKQMYIDVMNDYISQGHMKLSSNQTSTSGYFIPHHGILKMSSSSTPLRVVFDASAKSSNGSSLNDTLYTGPKLQTDIFKLLLQFRMFAVAMTADVRQMYRQINLQTEHQQYQKLLWRTDKTQPPKIFELTTVAFGVKPSPYLALRTLQQLSTDEKERFPDSSRRLINEVYMDDIISSVEEETDAINLYQQWLELFRAGGFSLVKWASNSAKVLNYIPANIRRLDKVEFSSDFLKILGLQWLPVTDKLVFNVNLKVKPPTKRNVLSQIAQIWDPLGLITPVTIWAKMFIQELWHLKINWDDPLPECLKKPWLKFSQELLILNTFEISRHIGLSQKRKHSLIGFADASEKAFAAVIYLRTENSDISNLVKTQLVCAKSRVAPLKSISIPRLELCAALLLAELLRSVLRTFSSQILIEEFYAFSDSMVVINWLKNSPHKWKTFVANRVTKIQELIPAEKWYHVKGTENPADCASRGLTPTQFVEHPTWVNGPSWLCEPKEQWPPQPCDFRPSDSVDLELKPVTCLVVAREVSPFLDLIDRCGSWSKLIRTTVWVLKFGRILINSSTITASDLETAELKLVQIIQQKHFSDIIANLKNSKLIPKNFRVLNPFVKDGILRVGGRLAKADISFDHKFPILLPKNNHFTELLINYLHKVNLHVGPNHLLALLRHKYWVFGARNLVRKIVQNCNICFRNSPKFSTPLMADLPSSRLSAIKPFYNTGTDFGGPFSVSISKHRGVKTQKAYICLFVCMASRAVHLECVSDLSSNAFLGALRRFLSRRGPVSTIYSDQGTNFVGAKRQLDALSEFLTSSEFSASVQEELAGRRIEWKLNPPAAPNFGGLWEAGIKSVKNHLNRVVGTQVLTFEEFTTVLCQIEAILNSRPLCWLSTDPSEPLALTPAHFLTLTPLQGFPTKDSEESNLNRLDRWELVQQLVKSFWNRWRLEYLSSLQSRFKWNTAVCPVRVGLVVLVYVENVSPLKWPLGVIQEVYPGSNGAIRVVLVKTKNGVLKRPVSKLAPLPTQ